MVVNNEAGLREKLLPLARSKTIYDLGDIGLGEAARQPA